MRRRELIFLLGSAVTAPGVVRAQQKVMSVIGLLGSLSPGPAAPFVAAFDQGLSETGYVEGHNLAIEYRWAEGRYDQLPALAADLIGRKVDVIAAFGSPSARAAKSATSMIPIVFASADPIGEGLVASLARPGGNLTGFSIMAPDLEPKRLELLSELAPQAGVIVLLVNPNNSNTERMIRDVQEAAREKRVRLQVLKASSESEIDAAFATLIQEHAGALVVIGSVIFSRRMAQIVALASRYAIPAIYTGRLYVETGGLLSYGSNLAETYRLKGIYTGKILKGAKPADLPVEQPSRFELVVNLKTAEALGLKVPPSILARATEVIE